MKTSTKSEEAELRKHGYMTPGEFVDALVPGLKEYLKHNWGCKPDELYHPEDLFSNAEIYLEVARHIAGDFIVASKNFKAPSKPKKDSDDFKAYCVSCKDTGTMLDPAVKVSDSGRRMAFGKCSTCGGKVQRILGKE